MRVARYLSGLIFIILPMGLAGFAHAVSVSIPGTANPYLAGMPNGSTAPPDDSAPPQSPVQVSGLNLDGGGILKFTGASGGVSRAPGCVNDCNPLDGNEFWDHTPGSQNGISDIRAPVESLVGVFLTDSAPNLFAPPASLNFQTLGLDFASLSPELQQVFFIGDGRTAGDVVQEFSIPADASRLFLGTMDGFGWWNNSGTMTVDVAQVVPETEIYAMLFAGLGLIWFAARRRIVSA